MSRLVAHGRVRRRSVRGDGIKKTRPIPWVHEVFMEIAQLGSVQLLKKALEPLGCIGPHDELSRFKRHVLARLHPAALTKVRGASWTAA